MAAVVLAGCADSKDTKAWFGNTFASKEWVDITPDAYVWNQEQKYKLEATYIDSAGNLLHPECQYDAGTKKCYMDADDFKKWLASEFRGREAINAWKAVNAK
jgi:hypothetical protein